MLLEGTEKTTAQEAFRTIALLGKNAHTVTLGYSPSMLLWGLGGPSGLLPLPDTATENREGKAT